MKHEHEQIRNDTGHPRGGGEKESPVRIAVIGTGWIAEKVYLPCLLNHDDIEVVAAHDESPEVLSHFAQTSGLDTHALGLQACFAPNTDGLLLCTPPAVHAQQIAQAISLEKYVLCEKPVFRHTSEFAMLGPTSAVASKLMGSASMRLRKDVSLLLRWVTDGVLGPLSHVRLGWWRERGVPAAGSWRTNPVYSPTGVLEDLGPHLLDLLASLITHDVWKELRVQNAALRCAYGHDPRRSASWFKGEPASPYTVPDQARVLFLSETGTRVEVEVSWANDTPGDYCSLWFRGARGTASLSGLLGLSTLRRSDRQYCSLQLDGQPPAVLNFPPGPGVQMQAFADSVDIFAGFSKNLRGPAADFFEIRRVTEWLTEIQQVAERSTTLNPGLTIFGMPTLEGETYR